MRRAYVVTGGAGFIGSNLVHHLLEHEPDAHVTVYDRLTYAGNLDNLAAFADDPRCRFVEGDICDRERVRTLLVDAKPNVVFHLAAESHVDRSIDGPGEFVRTNVVGTFEVLEAVRAVLPELPAEVRDGFRLLHISTDEVYGSLGAEGHFTEETRYAPNSPYAASKAGSDHLVRAYFHTYGLPVITTNCSNNYGPFQFPEKLIPLLVLNALDRKPLPIYGDGKNVRDWLYVRDHCAALLLVSQKGKPGEVYNVGGHNERTTLEIAHGVCDALDELAASQRSAAPALSSYRELIRFVADRPGHDRRYAIDAAKIERTLGWRPETRFDEGLRATVRWYLDNRSWCDRITQGVYRRERLGLARARG